jgi:hypothetical protein
VHDCVRSYGTRPCKVFCIVSDVELPQVAALLSHTAVSLRLTVGLLNSFGAAILRRSLSDS